VYDNGAERGCSDQARFDPSNPPNPCIVTWNGFTTDATGSWTYLSRGRPQDQDRGREGRGQHDRQRENDANAPDKLVRVFFRSFDVDDPSASSTPVDDESQLTDNCLEARLGLPQNCPIADDGFLLRPGWGSERSEPCERLLRSGHTGERGASRGRIARGSVYSVRTIASPLYSEHLAGSDHRTAGDNLRELLRPASAPGEDLAATGRAREAHGVVDAPPRSRPVAQRPYPREPLYPF
jgi:hypothetical protein